MRLSPRTKKIGRDLVRLRAQAVAVVLLLAIGVGVMVAGLGMRGSLGVARDAYYAANRLADLQVHLVRAPLALADTIAALPGVQAVDARATAPAVLDLPGVAEPVSAHVLSLDDPEATPVNRPWLVSGRWPLAAQPGEVVVNEAFMQAHGYQPGQVIDATIRGGRIRLIVVGVANSPEFVFISPPGEMFPQPDRYAVMWMPRRQLERAAGLDGAFNDLVLRTGPGTDAARLTRTIEALTDRYGGQRAQTRERIPSARFLDQELDQLATMSTILPPAFLAVAAFLLNVSLTRLVEAERSNIGLMKAFGFHAREVATGYLAMALVLTVAGVLAGYALGLWLGNAMAGIYLSVYRLPSLPFTPGAQALALGAGTALLAGFAGSLVAVRRVLALAPAVALAPPPPPAFQRGPALGEQVVRRLDALTRVVLRRIIGFPRRSLTTVLGLTAALSLLMLAQVANLATDRLLDLTFGKAKRQDVSLTLVEPGGIDALHALARLPGVVGAEPFRMTEAVFSGPGGEADEALVGLPAVAAYDRLIALDGTAVPLRDDGLVLTAGLARKLGVGPGDPVRIAPVRGERRPFVLRVASVEVVTVGNSAYLEIGAMGRLLGEPGRIDGAHLRIDPAQYDAFNQAVREAPRVVGVSYVGLARDSMEKIFKEGQGTMSGIFLGFAVLMVVGIAYATASVTLAEQRRDLATLQVLGYSRREASYVLVAELAVLALIAMPVGLVLGHWFSVSFLDAMATDLFTFPHTIDPAAYARAPAIVLGAVAAAVLLVRRDVDRINLVESLKSRE